MRRLRPLIAATALGLGASCASGARLGGPAPVPVDTTFYVSTRARDHGRDTRRLADSLEYGLVLTVRDRREDAVNDRELLFQLVDSVRLTREAFVAALRTHAAAEDFAVFYTHGFGTSLHEAWEQAVHARLRSRGGQPWVVFNWPAADGWLTWPQRGSILTASYRQDSAAATASRSAFLGAFGAVDEAVGSDRMLLFTHSLGIQVAAEALVREDAPRARLAARPLRGIAFHAADVDTARFLDVLVPGLRPIARRIVLYASSDDRALAVAALVSNTVRAGRIPRAGQLPVQHPSLESIDATVGASAEGFFRRLFGARHGVRHSNAALFDLVHLVGGERAGSCRESLGMAIRTAPTAWRFADSLPDPASTAACASHQRADSAEATIGGVGRTSATSSRLAPATPRAVRR